MRPPTPKFEWKPQGDGFVVKAEGRTYEVLRCQRGFVWRCGAIYGDVFKKASDCQRACEMFHFRERTKR